MMCTRVAFRPWEGTEAQVHFLGALKVTVALPAESQRRSSFGGHCRSWWKEIVFVQSASLRLV